MTQIEQLATVRVQSASIAMNRNTSNASPIESSYFLPNNEIEAAQLLSQHNVLIDALDGRIVLAPVDFSKPGLKILDSGTADGHWLHALRAALQQQQQLDPNLESSEASAPSNCSNPAHSYIGTDISHVLFPLQTPLDMHWYTHNIACPWPTEEHQTFNLVHQRLTLPGAAPTCPLDRAVGHLFDLAKPGGWIQLVEAEQVGPSSGPVFTQFLSLVRALSDSTGAG